jgi:hypothetical protein
MTYELMHKDVVVAVFDLNSDGSIIEKSINLLNREHCPIGGNSRSKMVSWWNGRAIPKSRQFIQRIIRSNIGISSLELSKKNLGLSLTDCYWIRPVDNKTLNWESVNLYENDFLDTNSLIRIDSKYMKYESGNFVPASSKGELEKFWVRSRSDNKCYLIKGNYSDKIQQSLNEIYISNVLDKLGLRHVRYESIGIKSDYAGTVGCICKSYTSSNMESISLYDLLVNFGAEKSNESWSRAIEILKKTGLNEEYIRSYLGTEILIDYAFSNLDRHLHNIEVLRNPDTLKIYGFAPMFDFGNSMFFRCNKAVSIPSGKRLSKLETHSFSISESKLLTHADKKIRINTSIMRDRTLFNTIYSRDNTKDKEFYEALWKSYQKKVDMLENYLNS